MIRGGYAAAAVLPAAVQLLAPAVALAQDEGGGLLTLDPGLIVWTWIIFIVLLLVLKRWAYPSLLGALEKREQKIRDALEQADRDRAEARRLLEEHRRLLDDARRQAQEIVAEGRKAAERLRGELLEEGREQKEEMLRRTREEIERERDQALDALRREAVDLSIGAASRVLRRNLDSAENRRLAEEFLEDVAATRGNGRAG